MDNERIMVAVDFGATSVRAFAKATQLALSLHAPLDIVSVTPPVAIEPSGQEDPAYVAVAREEIGKLASAARTLGLEVKAHLREETVVFGLLEAIAEIQPSLVVVGSHGRRGIKRALLGSVSEELARRSPVPVLIVPSPAREAVAVDTAWFCDACGHILGETDSTITCKRCGTTPAHWISAPVTRGPIDTAEPAVGEGAAVDDARPDTQDGAALFATSPPGGFTRTEANAEIRIRRF